MPKAFYEIVNVDNRIVHQAYREFTGIEDIYSVESNIIDEWAKKNFNVLVDMQLLAHKMMYEYNNSEQYNKFDPEPLDVFLLSAPQHLKHKLT